MKFVVKPQRYFLSEKCSARCAGNCVGKCGSLNIRCPIDR